MDGKALDESREGVWHGGFENVSVLVLKVPSCASSKFGY